MGPDKRDQGWNFIQFVLFPLTPLLSEITRRHNLELND